MAHGSASFKAGARVWMDGKYVNWDEARIHVMSHVIHYGSGVFEGIRAYKTRRGTAVFRLPEHCERLLGSARIYRMEIPYTRDDLVRICVEAVAENGFDACYIRPLVYRGYGSVGVNPAGCPVSLAVATWAWGAYLGAEGMEQGIDVQVSSWARMAPNTLPAMAKASANYMNAQLIKMEAVANGFHEGIALNRDGTVSEGSAENIFVVKEGEILTPPLAASVLAGITRRTVMTLAGDLGIPVRETGIPREMLYLADEVFFTGTAAEVTPIRSIDRLPVGAGKRGPVTAKIQQAFFDVVQGEVDDRHNWLTPVPAGRGGAAGGGC